MTYSSIQLCSSVVLTIFNFIFCSRKGHPKLTSFLIAGFNTVMIWSGIFFITWVSNGFSDFGAQNAVRGYVLLPLIMWLENKIFGIDFRELCDRCAVGPLLAYAVGHIGCIFAGCCHGFEYEEGTTAYNVAMKLTGTNMLPQQLFESLSAFITCAFLFIIFIRKKQDMGGRLLFIMTISYGIQRFFWEFLRDNKKLIVIKEMAGAVKRNSDGAQAYWGISELSFWAIAMVVEGIIFLIVLNKIDKKAAEKQALTA